ncbi:ribosome hibernation-promoting factor, HPF/YfiA family [Kaarinaea lacus]
MQQPLQITFRDIPHSGSVEEVIREKAAKLDQYFEKIMSCRVTIESPHAHQHQGRLYHVTVDITVPGTELVASRSTDKNHAHEDVYVAIRDAFEAAKRQLKEYKDKLKKQVKSHEVPAHGLVTELVEGQDYGRIQTPDGRDIYFHRNSLVRGGYDDLEVGSEVRFIEESGEEGPQASTVHMVGKHHIVE